MKFAQRIHLKQITKDSDYQRLVAFLEKHRSCFDELTLFTGYCHHGAIPLAELKPQADIIGKRIADLKKHGFNRVGINVHTTFGHIDEGYDFYGQPFHPMVGFDGTYAKACFCPEHEDMKQFLWDKYMMYARTAPDFMWVDDDVKFFWNGVKFACFCPACMNRFNKKMGTSYSREELVAAMETPDAVELRAAWVQDIQNRITELFVMLRKAVDQVDSNIQLGFQSQHQGWSTYNGMDFANWYPALRATMGRPGEGTYDDKTPLNVCTKALSTARQASEYPDCVTDVQYEIEDFPNYSLLQKSARFNTAEISLALAQGINGILANTFYPDGVMNGVEIDSMYSQFVRLRPNWDAMEQFARGMHGTGFYPAISSKHDQHRVLDEGESFFKTYDESAKHNVLNTYTLCHSGIPLTVDAEHAYGAVFTGNLPDGFTDSELLEFLKKSVILDADAARVLERRGFGKLLGVHVDNKIYEDSVEEQFTNHPVNTGFVGHIRDVHPAFYGGSASILEVLDERAEVISTLNDMHDEVIGAAAVLYENELGGRVCILGYAAYQKIDSLPRQIQMRRVADWLAGDTMGTKFMESCLAAQFVQTNGDKVMATIINLSLDTMDNVPFAVRGADHAMLLYNGKQIAVNASVENGMSVYALPKLLPFETCTLLIS